MVEVSPGADRNEAAIAALASQGARPFTAEEFTETGLVWNQFHDSNPGNDSVIQRYNPQNEPANVDGLTALTNTHTTWNNVPTSSFSFEYGGTTDKCPSLVQECRGPQRFDGNNDVAWVPLREFNTLGVTWSGTNSNGDAEADVAMNSDRSWATTGADIDVETVYLHENGHVAGIGHSQYTDAIMAPYYDGVHRTLFPDDIDAITTLYPGTSTPTNNSPSVLISSPSDNSSFDSSTLISFTGSANDAEDGDLTSDISWTSDIDGPIGTGGSFSFSLSDGTHSITAEVTDAGGITSNDSITIIVGTPPVTGTTVSIDSITYGGEGGKNSDKHLIISVHASDGANSVSGASVSIVLYRDGTLIGSATGTTGSSGSTGFTLKNAASGLYTTTITDVSASGLTWDGTTPENSHLK